MLTLGSAVCVCLQMTEDAAADPRNQTDPRVVAGAGDLAAPVLPSPAGAGAGGSDDAARAAGFSAVDVDVVVEADEAEDAAAEDVEDADVDVLSPMHHGAGLTPAWHPHVHANMVWVGGRDRPSALVPASALLRDSSGSRDAAAGGGHAAGAFDTQPLVLPPKHPTPADEPPPQACVESGTLTVLASTVLAAAPAHRAEASMR